MEKKELSSEVKDSGLDYKSRIPGEITEEQKEEMEKTRKELDNFKKKVLKKYPFTIALGILPPQAAEKIEEEEIQDPSQLEEVKKTKPVHMIMLIPEDNYKDIPKIKADLLKEVKEMKEKTWLHIKTPVDVWNYCMDGKYDMQSAIAMSYPLHDNGFLGGLRVCEIHKSLVLRKFERYIVSYVMCGSFVRGDATKTSDVDVFIVIDDTDVKRMPRLELKEKLRGIIYQYIYEASELAGVKNKLNVQVYILTEFWESVKDANPVIFTMLRDGYPLYDRGTFMPWKLLLKMGKLKPSPEAIDMFMGMGDKMEKTVKTVLTDLIIGDIYWGVITPAQALLMLFGLAPPTTKETPKVFRETFVEKEKILEKKYADILEKIVGTYKAFEHEKIKDGDLKGKDVDEYLKDAVDYLKRLKELRVQIEKRSQEKTIDEIYTSVIGMLQGMFGKKSEEALVSDFEKNVVKKGNLPDFYLRILYDLIKAKEEFKKGKMEKHEIESVRKNAYDLINHLIEYTQRCELSAMQKARMKLKAKDKTYEIIFTPSIVFLIDDGKINKVENGKIKDSNGEEFTKAISEMKNKEVVIDEKIFEVLRKHIGNFEIVL